MHARFALGPLNERAPLSRKLECFHGLLRDRFEHIDRISVVVYDPHTDLLKTFLQSSDDRSSLMRYEARLADVPSLKQLVVSGRPRTIDDLRDYAGSQSEHTRQILATGYHSSYTLPMFLQDEFYGFIFFDSRVPARFTGELIAHIAPLHDVGKVAIPDSILLKPGPLTPDEFDMMKTHAKKGLEIVDFMLHEFGLIHLAYVDIMRNIVQLHHEAVDGSGYPFGLRGDAIPLEARITATADIFDALTSRRHYKPAWSIDTAFAELRQVAGKKLDEQCVEALIRHRDDVETIRAQLQETTFG